MKAHYKISQEDYVNAGNLYGKLTKNQSIICALIATACVAAIFFGPNYIKGAVIGGLVAGFGSLTGRLSRKLFTR